MKAWCTIFLELCDTQWIDGVSFGLCRDGFDAARLLIKCKRFTSTGNSQSICLSMSPWGDAKFIHCDRSELVFWYWRWRWPGTLKPAFGSLPKFALVYFRRIDLVVV